eukprot:jgi/Hompol1/5737/HPOL_002527-RA
MYTLFLSLNHSPNPLTLLSFNSVSLFIPEMIQNFHIAPDKDSLQTNALEIVSHVLKFWNAHYLANAMPSTRRQRKVASSAVGQAAQSKSGSRGDARTDVATNNDEKSGVDLRGESRDDGTSQGGSAAVSVGSGLDQSLNDDAMDDNQDTDELDGENDEDETDQQIDDTLEQEADGDGDQTISQELPHGSKGELVEAQVDSEAHGGENSEAGLGDGATKAQTDTDDQTSSEQGEQQQTDGATTAQQETEDLVTSSHTGSAGAIAVKTENTSQGEAGSPITTSAGEPDAVETTSAAVSSDPNAPDQTPQQIDDASASQPEPGLTEAAAQESQAESQIEATAASSDNAEAPAETADAPLPAPKNTETYRVFDDDDDGSHAFVPPSQLGVPFPSGSGIIAAPVMDAAIRTDTSNNTSDGALLASGRLSMLSALGRPHGSEGTDSTSKTRLDASAAATFGGHADSHGGNNSDGADTAMQPSQNDEADPDMTDPPIPDKKADGAWSFHTEMHGTDLPTHTVQLRTIFCQPQKVLPVSLATASVWFQVTLSQASFQLAYNQTK